MPLSFFDDLAAFGSKHLWQRAPKPKELPLTAVEMAGFD
jgi:hypothetical protein